VARIVIVDDERLIAEACAAALRAAGYQVSIANDGESGVRLVTEILPDVVVSDIRMPDIDGHELISRLKAQAATTHIPVLLMSGHCQADEKSCDAFLAKPFRVRELLEIVRNLATRRAGPQS
jgi:DNA-binding response OmpR family regulator